MMSKPEIVRRSDLCAVSVSCVPCRVGAGRTCVHVCLLKANDVNVMDLCQ